MDLITTALQTLADAGRRFTALALDPDYLPLSVGIALVVVGLLVRWMRQGRRRRTD